jgi:predicted transcriptional regulator
VYLSNDGNKPREFILGPLEWQIMLVLWRSRAACSVRAVVERLPQKRQYTTVMTTLGRLFRKGLVNRASAERKFFYSARVSHQQLEMLSANYLLSNLRSMLSASAAPEPILSYFMKNLAEYDGRRRVKATHRRQKANR